MNRLITSDVKQVTPDRLPPVQRQGPARMLFINTLSVGFTTQARQLKKYTANRDDIDAVHFDIDPPLWAKILHKRIEPMGAWDLCSYRILRVWGWILRRWLNGPLSTNHFDVVHIMTQGIGLPVAERGGSGRPGRRPRFAVHIDTTGILEVREHGLPALAQRPFISAERRIYTAADLVVAMSQWAGRSVRNDYSVPENRVYVAPGCVTLPEIDERILREKQQAGRKPKIIFVANDWKLKGGPLLLRVHQRSLVGKAELHVVCRSAPRTPAPDVVWHGQIPWEDLMRMIQSMDIFCNPTRVDMSPWSVVEAVTAGLPVVSTRMSAIPEMVVDGQTGFLCDKDDEAAVERALLKLVGDSDLRISMSAAARKHAHQYYDADRVYGDLMDRLCLLAQS